MPPADQRLNAGNFVRLDVDDRMVMQLELIVRQRIAQIVLIGAAPAGLNAHRIVEKAVGVAALGLGSVQREVGILHQLVDSRAMLGRQRDADAGANIEMMPVELARRGDCCQELVGRRDRSFPLVAVDRRQNRKFVAA